MNRTQKTNKRAALIAFLFICVLLTGALPVFALVDGNGASADPGTVNGMNGDGGALNDVGNGVREGVEDIGNGVREGVEDIGNGVREGAEDIGNGMRDGANDVGNGIGDVARSDTRNMGAVRDADGFISNDGTPDNTRQDRSPISWIGIVIGLVAASAVILAVVLLVPKKKTERSGNGSGNINRR